MLRSIKSNQREMKILHCQIDGAGGILTYGGLSGEVALTVNGAGDYTLAIDPAYGRVPMVLATVTGANDYAYSDNIAVGSVDVLTGSAGHQFVDVLIIGSQVEDEV